MGAAVGEPQGSVAGDRPVIDGMEKKIKALPAVDLKNVGLKDVPKKEWNTKNLGQRLGVDVACAATAGGMVAPIICMIDKCVESKNGC